MTEDISDNQNSRKIGILGEEIARKFLLQKGYQILDNNFSFKITKGPLFAEIDLIGSKDEIVTFFEVKTKINDKIQPEEKVNTAKINKIKKTAQIWLDKNKKYQECPWQIDIISIVPDFTIRRAKITHFKNI